MNKNTLFMIVAIGAILTGYSIYSSRQMQQAQQERRRMDSIAYANAAANAPIQQSIEQEIIALAAVDTTPAKIFTMENENLHISLTSKGGSIVSTKVKNYSTYAGDTIALMQGGSKDFSLTFYTNNSRNFQSHELNFEAMENTSTNDTQTLVLRHSFTENTHLDYIYKLARGAYVVDFAVRTIGLGNVHNVDLAWNNDALRQEKAFANENNYTTIAYRCPSEDGVEELSIGKSTEQENLTTKVEWVAFKQQFFSTILIARGDAFAGAQLEYATYPENNPQQLIKHYSARMALPYQQMSDQTLQFSFYFGPNKYSILKSYGNEFQKLVPLGSWIIGWVNRLVVIPIFDVLEKHIASYGLIILILTILIKLVLFPLTFKSYISSAKMRVLKPDVERINKKYPSKNDAVKKQQEIMALYKKTGVNPMGGCLPILVQFPILIAMFRFFPASIELRQQAFLWADDLSAYDSILNLPFSIPFYGEHVSLFTLLMAVALYVSSRMNMAQTPDTGMPGMKFMTLYLMPIMLLVWFNSYSAGLSYYYFLSNLITIGQNLVTRRMVDDKKLHIQLKENSKKPVKKSKFQAKLENIARKQQQQKKMQRR